MVQDHRTAVIGGLLADESDTSDSGVSFFSEIPVLGNLFSDRGSMSGLFNRIDYLLLHLIASVIRSDYNRHHEPLLAVAKGR
jgi:hypothetical protein